MRLFEDWALIGGHWQGAAGDRQFAVVNPADGSEIARVSDCSAADAQKALEAAKAAFASWRRTTAAERSSVLRRWAELMLARQEELAQLLTAEQGKPLAEARGEVAYAAGFLTWFAEEGRRSHGGVVPSHRRDARIVVLKEPVGVVAAVTPWNFPLAMITRKIGPALRPAAPSSSSPPRIRRFRRWRSPGLGEEAGVPAGVVSVVTTRSPADVVGVWMASPVVRKFSFTGSTATGKLLMRQSADTVKRLSLELGGNAPLIVFDDADIDLAVRGTIASKFRNTGQTCVCANRILVEDGNLRSLCRGAECGGRGAEGGARHEDGAAQGPLINAPALAKVERHVADAVAKGATVLTGGASHERGGLFYAPTVLTGMSRRTWRWRTRRRSDPSPASSASRARRKPSRLPTPPRPGFPPISSRAIWPVPGASPSALEAGMVGINEGVISTEVAPFGGVKQSGLGREGASEGLDEYLESKYVLFGGLSA